MQPTEMEAGDVVLWVRDWLVIFEVFWRNPITGTNIDRVFKKLGNKRDQLINDFEVYGNSATTITMTNEDGEFSEYDRRYFNRKTTRGVVIVDADGYTGSIGYETLRLSLEADHPIAIMTRQDFEVILTEVDTVGDLGIYLGDRHTFLRHKFSSDPKPFQGLGSNLEPQLVGLYKLFDNRFDGQSWDESSDKLFWDRYHSDRKDDIARRNEENDASELLDGLIDSIRASNRPESVTLHAAWELALLTRRERSQLDSSIRPV